MNNNLTKNSEDKLYKLIQPHGCVIVLNQDLNIIYCSNNIDELLKTPISQVLNKSIQNFLKLEVGYEDTRDWLNNEMNKYRQMFWQSPNEKISIWVLSHQVSNKIILEVEPNKIENDETDRIYAFAQYTITDLQLVQRSLPELLQKTCEKIQKATDFDRIFVYRLNEHNQSGKVINEVLKSNIPSYFGLSFPGFLTPMNLSKTMIEFPFKYNPDINKKNVEIISKNNKLSHNDIDLSKVTLLAVPPLIQQYLADLGIKSTFRVAITHNKKVWGLLICNSLTVKFLSIRLRFMIMNAINTISSKITEIEYDKVMSSYIQSRISCSELSEAFIKADSLNHALELYHKQLMQLVSATGMSIYSFGNLISFCSTPSRDQLLGLIAWLQSNQLSKPYETSSLPKQFAASLEYKDKACGLMVLPITNLQNHYILFYRPETTHKISWVSDATKLTIENELSSDSSRITEEKIKNQSLPWTINEIQSLEFIQPIILNKRVEDLLKLKLFEERQQYKQRILLARRAGRAEVANNVLHNVGNVLNSVNVSATMIRDKINQSKVSNIRSIADLIDQQKDNMNTFIHKTTQGQLLLEYIQKLGEICVQDQMYLAHEINELQDNLNYIKKIIYQQQSFSGQYHSVEMVDVSKIIQDSLDVHKIHFANNNIIIIFKYKIVKQIELDQVKLQQVLVNLIKNSIDSLIERNNTNKKIIFYVRQKNNNNFEIKVEDNGLGITPENLTKIFSFGFTTKENGHGFGLHGSALIIKEMGGTISFKSNGVNLGATFAIVLPNMLSF